MRLTKKAVYQLEDGDVIQQGDFTRISEAFLMETCRIGKVYNSRKFQPMYRVVDMDRVITGRGPII